MTPDIEPNPARRGRRDPDLAQRMLENDLPGEDGNHLEDYGDAADVSFVGLMPGDIVVAKAAISGKTPTGDEAWFTWGVQSHVAPTETEADAAERISTIVNQRVMELADDMFATLHERMEEARRSRGRIPTRRSDDID